MALEMLIAEKTALDALWYAQQASDLLVYDWLKNN